MAERMTEERLDEIEAQNSIDWGDGPMARDPLAEELTTTVRACWAAETLGNKHAKLLASEIRVLQTELREARAVLAKYEWMSGRCSECGGFHPDGHAPNCRMARALGRDDDGTN